MKTLLCGPWVGEFGWELFCWQGRIRKISRKFDKTIVVSRPGHNVLYSDFCNEYIEFDPKSYEVNAYECKKTTEDFEKIRKSVVCDKYIDGRKKWMSFNKHAGYWPKEFFDQEYVKYGIFDQRLSFDFIFHARSTKKYNTGYRNWDKNNWISLREKLSGFRIASIGTKTDAICVDETEDFRGIDLKKLVNILASSKGIVGPSSGPMHLATLCGLPQVVWSPDCNRQKYEKLWNPLKTKAIFFSKDGWNPKVNDIFGLSLKLI